MVYFLGGQLPATAQLHHCQPTWFGMVFQLKESVLHKDFKYKLITCKLSSNSWVMKIHKLCLLYRPWFTYKEKIQIPGQFSHHWLLGTKTPQWSSWFRLLSLFQTTVHSTCPLWFHTQSGLHVGLIHLRLTRQWCRHKCYHEGISLTSLPDTGLHCFLEGCNNAVGSLDHIYIVQLWTQLDRKCLTFAKNYPPVYAPTQPASSSPRGCSLPLLYALEQ